MNSKNPIWWEIFINEYIKNGQNGVQAMKKAQPHLGDKAASVKYARLIANDRFKALFDSAQKSAAKSIGMTRERWLKLLCDIAEFNISEFAAPSVGSDVEVKQDWEKNDKAHVIEAISSQTTTDEDGRVFTKTQIKAASKIKALEILGKALGYQEDKIEVNHSGNIGIVLDDQILGQLGAIKSRFPIPGF